MPMTQRFPEDMSERELRALQKDVHTIIEYFAGPGKKNTIVSSPGLTAFKGTAVEVTLGYFAQGSPAGAIIQRIGKTRDCVLGLTIALLERAKASPIMRCSQCDKIFYRRGKMMFCSRTCTNREMAQRKRAGHSKPRTKKTQAKKKSRKG
jgi:hypothetical protein